MLSNDTKAKKTATEAVMKLLVDNGIDVSIISDEEADRLIRHYDDAPKQIVYHGSGATFDAFDFSHMSEGEGNQAFGWGGYVSEVESIGMTYAKMNDSSLRRSRIEYEISQLEKAIPFRRGEAKLEGERELRQWKRELAKYDGENKSFLYTVSIPNDNGKNYLDWNGHPSKALLDTLADILMDEGWEHVKSANGLFRVEKGGGSIVLNERQSGADLYAELSEALGSDKAASDLLYNAGLTGIAYPTNTIRGVNTDGTRNYVIFNEDDMRIMDMVQLMRTGDSTIYGFSVGNRIYLTERGINPETPIHEYTHLWAKSMMLHNKEAWESVKAKLRTTQVWEEVRNDVAYEQIKDSDDEVASEVLARVSGRHNSRYFVQEAENAQSASDLIDSMRDLWKWVGGTLFGKKDFENVEDITNTVLYDLLNNTDLRLDMGQRQTIHVLSTSDYEDVRPLAHGVKDGDIGSIDTAAKEISDMLIHLGNPEDYVLVPMPSHEGDATYTLDMVRTISMRTDINYMDILSSEPHESFYDKKLKDGLTSIKPIKFHSYSYDKLPRDKKIILVDNVLDTGTTAVSASRFFGREVYMAVLGNTANSKQFPYDIDITQGLDSLYNKVYTEEERNIISEAKASGTYLLAPNGQPTNLNPRQWVQVRTNAFKRWFGDWENDPTNSSKIVDEKGEPMVVFHGRSKDFNEFKRVQGERYEITIPVDVTSEGFFFTPDRSVAEHFAANAESIRGGKRNVLESFLNIKNPLDLVSTEDYPGEYEKATGWKYNVYMDTQDNLWEMMDVEGISDILTSKGYDGVYFAEERDDDYKVTKMSYCALNPSQIKSARNNIGLFSGDMNDIRFQKVSFSDEYDRDTERIFATAKTYFGETRNFLEAGYLLPDGTMLDFSGRHEVDERFKTDFNGNRDVDHADISDINFLKDGNTPSGITTDMSDFITRGAIRIDGLKGVINLAQRPTKEQYDVLRRLITMTKGIAVDFGDGNNTQYYIEYDNAKPSRVLSDIDRYFEEGIRPVPRPMYQMTGQEQNPNDTALRDALIDRLRDSGIDVITDVEEGNRVLNLAANARMSFTSSYDEFQTLRRAAIENNGIVTSGLSSASVRIVDVPRHDFTGSFSEAAKQAKDWAKFNIVGKEYPFGINGGTYVISNRSVEKYLSQSAVSKSENTGVHLSVLKKLPEIIGNSLDVEIHADYRKGEDGIRRIDNGIVRGDLLVHRVFGAVECENVVYRVKTTLHEYESSKHDNIPHSYEIAKIELLEAPSRERSDLGTNNREPLAMTSNNSISAAKLLENVEKSYDKGKLILKESEKSDINFLHGIPRTRYQRVFHGSPFDFDKFDSSHIGEGVGQQTNGLGLYFTDNKDKAQEYSGGGMLYIADIPDASKDKYLDNDNPVEKSKADEIMSRLYYEIIRKDDDGMYEDSTSRRYLKGELTNAISAEMTGADIYGTISSYLGGDEETVRFLQEIGYSGLTYKDKDTVNYVVFNDEDIDIVDKIHVAHSYEIAKIELREAPRSRQISSEGADNRRPVAMTSNNSISAAKLLENVEKSYDKGKLILKENEKSDINFLHGTPRMRYQKVYHGSSADFDAFDFGHMGEGEGSQYYGWGGYVTTNPTTGEHYASLKRYGEARPFVYEGKRYSASGIIKKLVGIKNLGSRHLLWNSYINNIIAGGQQSADNKLSEYIKNVKERVASDPSSMNEELYKEFKEDSESILAHKDSIAYSPKSSAYLYTVEIPDDNGTNYLRWDKPLTSEQIEMWKKALVASVSRADREEILRWAEDVLANRLEDNPFTGQDAYYHIDGSHSSRKASTYLAKVGFTGMSVPVMYQSQRKFDLGTNYVIFKKEDLEIKDKVRLFKTTTGEAYGFTVGGKIYIDPSVATAETPIHEYSHLWVHALQKGNPEEWENVKSMMKKTPIWKEVRELYPELTEEDEIADEVVATYSGRRGIDRLRSDVAAMSMDGKIRKEQILGVIDRMTEALSRLWAAVADMFHIHYTSPEMVADIIMRDMTRGFNPRKEIIQIEYTREEEEIISEAKASGTYLLAPNGQPTNLNPRQWVQVRTNAFKEWFGDWEKDPGNSSQIVDANGEPKVVYHGSRTAGFTVFDSDMGDIHSMAPKGSVWFADTRENAYSYSGTNSSADLRNRPEDEREMTPGIYECFLNVRNPWREDYQGASWQGDLYGKYELMELDEDNTYVQTHFNSKGEYFDSEEEARDEAGKLGLKHYEIRKDPWIGSNVNMVADEVMDNSYGEDNDGVVIERVIDNGVHSYGDYVGTDYVVWNSRQIKSATQNTGQFMSDEEDIRFQIIGPMGARALDLAMGSDERISAARVAIRMEKQGKDNVAIWRATGWERGADGNWRYEIPSFRLAPVFDAIKAKPTTRQINNTLEKIIGEGTTLDKVITGENGELPDLFKAYPSLRDVKVVKDKNRKNSGVAAYNRKDNTIIIRNASGYWSLMWSFIHEIQHVIQNIEGFTGGYSVGKYNHDRMSYLKDNDPMMYSMLHLFGYTNWASLKRCDIKTVIEAVQSYRLMKMPVEEMDEGTRKTYDNIIHFLSRLEGMSRYEWNSLIADAKKEQTSIVRRGNEIYKLIAGEVEANNAEDRMFFKDEEEKVRKMRETPPSETEGVPRSKQITSIPFGGVAAMNNKENNSNTNNMEYDNTITDQEKQLVSQVAIDMQTGRYLLGERSQQYKDIFEEIRTCHEKLTSQTQQWLTPREKAILAAELEMYHDGAQDLEDFYGIPTFLTIGVLGADTVYPAEMKKIARSYEALVTTHEDNVTYHESTFLAYARQMLGDIKNGVELTVRQKETMSDIISNMKDGASVLSQQIGVDENTMNDAIRMDSRERISRISVYDFRNSVNKYNLTDNQLYLLANAIQMKYSRNTPINTNNPYLDKEGNFVGDENFREFVRNYEQEILDFQNTKLNEINEAIRKAKPLTKAERQILGGVIATYNRIATYGSVHNLETDDVLDALFGEEYHKKKYVQRSSPNSNLIGAQVVDTTIDAVYDIEKGQPFYEISPISEGPYMTGVLFDRMRNKEIETGKEPTIIDRSAYDETQVALADNYADAVNILEAISKEETQYASKNYEQGIRLVEYHGIVTSYELDRTNEQDEEKVKGVKYLVPIENSYDYDATRVIERLKELRYKVRDNINANPPTLIPSAVEFDDIIMAQSFAPTINSYYTAEKQNKKPFSEEYVKHLNWVAQSNYTKHTIPISFETKADLKAYIVRYCEEHGWDADLNHIDVSRITDMSELFMGTKFNGDISGWNVSNVTNMSKMFENSQFNQSISNWDVWNVTNMKGIFAWSYFNGDISRWNVSSVTDMSGMFFGSSFNGDISRWDVSKVTNMTEMFKQSEFTGDISGWDVSNVTDMSQMFNFGKFNQPIGDWNTQNVTKMDSMFENSEFKGDISGWNVSNVTNMHCMFSSSQFNGDISKWDTSSVTDMSYMFDDSKFNQDISRWDVSKVRYMNGMFFRSQFNQPIGNWDVRNVTDMNGMFAYSNFGGDLSGWKIQPGTNVEIMFEGTGREGYEKELFSPTPERVSFDNKAELKAYIVRYCEEHGWDADLNHIDVSRITDMSNLFMDTSFNGDISGWDVSNVTNMSCMLSFSSFDGDISNWDVSNVTNMSYMFEGSEFNQSIGNWDTGNVTNMEGMFASSHFNQPIGDWNVSSVTNMHEMFQNTHFNQPLDNWDVSNVNDMTGMFSWSRFDGNISKWSVQPGTLTDGIFSGTDLEGRERELVFPTLYYGEFEEKAKKATGLSKSQLYLLGKALQSVAINNKEMDVPTIKVGLSANPYLFYGNINAKEYEKFASENKDMLLKYVNHADSQASTVVKDEVLPFADFIRTLEYELETNHDINGFEKISEQDFSQMKEDGRHGLLTTDENYNLVHGPLYNLLPEALKLYTDAYLNIRRQYVQETPDGIEIDIEGENLNAAIYKSCRDNYENCNEAWNDRRWTTNRISNDMEREATRFGEYIKDFLKDGQQVHVPELEDGYISRKGDNVYVTTDDEYYRIYPTDGNSEAVIRAGLIFFEQQVTDLINNPERQAILASKDKRPLVTYTPDGRGIHCISIIGKDDNSRMFTNEDYFYYYMEGHHLDIAVDDYMKLLSAVVHEKDHGTNIQKEREAYYDILGYLHDPLGLNDNNGIVKIAETPLLQLPYVRIPYANKMQMLGEYQLEYDNDNSRVNIRPIDMFDRHIPSLPLEQIFRQNRNDMQQILTHIRMKDLLKSMDSYARISWQEPVRLQDGYSLYAINQNSSEPIEILHESPDGNEIVHMGDITSRMFVNIGTAVQDKVRELNNTPVELMPNGCIRIDTVLTERTDDKATYDIVANGDTIGSFRATNKEEEDITEGEYTATMLACQRLYERYKMHNSIEYLMSDNYNNAQAHNYESLNEFHSKLMKYYKYNSLSLDKQEASDVNAFKHFTNETVFNRFVSSPIRDEKNMTPIEYFKKALGSLTPFQRQYYFDHFLSGDNQYAIEGQDNENETRKHYSNILSFGIMNADKLNESEKTIVRTLETFKTEGDLQKWAAEVRYTGSLDFSDATPQEIREDIRILGNTIYNADDETLRGIHYDCSMERDSNEILRKRALSIINQYNHQKELHPEDLILFRNGMGFSVFYEDIKSVNNATGWNITSDTESGIYIINITKDGYEALAEKNLNLRVVTPSWSIRPVAERYDNEYVSHLQTVDNALKDLIGVHEASILPMQIGDAKVSRLYFGPNGIVGEDERGNKINIRDISRKSFNFVAIDKMAEIISKGEYQVMEKTENQEIQMSIGEKKPVDKNDVSRHVTETLIHSLNKAGIRVNYATQSDVRAAVLDSTGDIAFDGKDRKSLMRDGNSMVFGWVSKGEIYLTEEGMNPETPIHEYTHLWAAALEDKNPRLWNNIKDLVRETPIWDEVLSDGNYSNIRDDENRVASEVLARISGRENSKKLLESYGDNVNEPQTILDRLTEAMEKFWNWVSTTMFGYSNLRSIEEITDRILYDLVGGTPLDLTDSREFQIQDVKQPERVSFEGKEDLKAYIDSYCNEHGWDADLNHIDVSRITDMSEVFFNTRFTGDISQWDTSNVTNMEGMFAWSSFNGDISKWDTSNVTSMRHMFNRSAFNQDISGWNVSNVTNMSQMFENSQFNQPIGNWDTKNVVNMDSMFSGSHFNQPIGDWNTGNVTNMMAMFAHSVFDQPIGYWNTSNVKEMLQMFAFARFNQPISDWNTSKVERMSGMFENNTSFNQPIGNWDTSNVKYMDFMFYGSSFNGNISKWDVSNVEDMYAMFTNSRFDGNVTTWNVKQKSLMDNAIKNSRIEGIDGVIYNAPERVSFEGKEDLKAYIEEYCDEHGWDADLNHIDVSKITDMSELFMDTSFNGDISGWDVSNVTNMSGMFANSPFNGDISRWDVSNVTDMSQMFASSYFNQPIGDWNTQNVTKMDSMFENSEFKGDISGWNVSNVTNMQSMFSFSQFNGDISRWNVSNVTNMSYMFEHSKFNQDISRWDVSKVRYMNGMFLKSQFDQPIGGWNVGNVTDMNGMFVRSGFNQPIGDWNTSKVEDMSYMFEDSKFNQDISRWDVSKVRYMNGMFLKSQFDQPIGNWNVSSVTNAKGMFEESQMNHLPKEWNLPKDTDITSMFKGTTLDGREAELQKKTDTPKASEAQAESTSNNLNSNNMAEETKNPKEQDRSFELKDKELQKYLLSEALERAKTNDGVWFNPKHHGSPTMYPKMDTEINAFNVLVMTLMTDHRNYKTNMFTTFNEAKGNGFGILTGQKSLPYNWYSWDNYVNKFNPNQSLTAKEYKALPEEEKVLFKAVPKKEQRAVFNIEQTSMYKAKPEDYKMVVEKDRDTLANEYYSKLSHKMTYKEAYEELRQRPDRPENEVIVFEKDKFMYLLNEDAVVAAQITGLAPNDKVAQGLNVDKALRVLSKDHAMLFSKLLAHNYKVNIQDAPSKIDVSNKANEVLMQYADRAGSFVNAVTDKMGVKQVINPMITSPVSYDCESDRIVSKSMKATGAAQLSEINDTYKALVAATGCNQRLNRARTFDSDDKYEQLVREVSAAILMSRDGFSGQLSKPNIENIDYWKREIVEDNNLLDRLERDVNNTIQVLDKLSIGRDIDYVRVRGDKTEAQLDRRYYSITEALEKMVDADTHEVVVIADKADKSAYVILPQGASLEVGNELPGMNKNRFVIALKKQGIDDVKFYNAGGALGIRQPNNFYNDKEITVSKLKQYDLNTIKEVDVAEEIARTNKVEIDKVVALKDDNQKWAFYVKPSNKPSFTIYPETGDLSMFFKAMKSGDTESFNKVREDIGQKYASLVEARPELKADILDVKNTDFDLSRISRVSISKDENNGKTLLIVAVIDGKKMEQTLDPVQSQRFWLVDDKSKYKVSLAVQLFGPELKNENAEQQKAKPYYFNVAYIQDSDSLKSLDELLGKDQKAFITEISNYDQGDGIELEAVTKTSKTSGHSTVVAENESYVVTRDAAAGGDYTVLRKVTEEDVRSAIERYGLPSDATDDVKHLAYEMTQEKFDNMEKQPIVEMPSGAVLYLQYNKDTNNIEVGTATNAGIKVDHTFEYDNSKSLDHNLEGVVEELNEMEEYQEEEQEEQEEERPSRRSAFRR